MKSEDRHHLRTSLLDTLIYIQTYAPDFPGEDQTSLAREASQMMAKLKALRELLKSEDQKTLHDLATQELSEAIECYAASQDDRANTLIDHAITHLKQSFGGKRIRPAFIAGPDGQIMKA